MTETDLIAFHSLPSAPDIRTSALSAAHTSW